MTPIPLLDDLVVLFAVGLGVALLLSRVRLPATAGLLLAGALVGPGGFGVVPSIHAIEALAEVGVVLLLFTVGLEFSLSRFARIGRLLVLGGSLQVGLTAATAAGVAIALGLAGPKALFFGFAVALSSTAMVLRLLGDRGELDAPHGRFIVGVLIFQDLVVIPMMLVLPQMAPAAPGGGGIWPVLVALGKACAVVAATLVAARFVVPKLLRRVDQTRSREIFLLAVVFLCVGTAWLTSKAGVSLALGAFLGGLVVADTEFRHRALGNLLPLREIFMALFFVSMGMLFDPKELSEHTGTMLLLLGAFLFGKGFLATIAALAMKFPLRVAVTAGIGLAQFGEFGFVLATVALGVGILSRGEMQTFLSAGILSMFITPVLLTLAPHLSAGARLLRPLERLLGARSLPESTADEEAWSDHVLIVGYGVAGSVLAHSLASVGIHYRVLELNAETVRKASEEGVPIYYADASTDEALAHAHVREARAVVVLINDDQAATRVVDAVKRLAPELPIIVRARYLGQRQGLVKLGATEVVAEEVEASLEVLARVLRRFDIPRNVIDAQVGRARASTQESARGLTVPRKRLCEIDELRELRIELVSLEEGHRAVGRSLRDLALRELTGAMVVARGRGEILEEQLDVDEPLAAEDRLYLVGRFEAVARATRLLTHEEPSTEAT
ncbi:MAG: cation:proton antiporter [Polyangia bacterium]|jgi:CPA2 family monovalent cation:H+ antiporter-2|nr:cation:proton antiporter [Polyangia bacterium]